MKKILFLFLSVLVLNIWPSDSTAVKWLWEGIYMFNYEMTSQNAVKHKKGSGYSDMDWGFLSIQLPVHMKKESPFYFGAGLIYYQYHLDFNGSKPDEMSFNYKDEVAHDLRLLLGFNYRFSKNLHLYWEYNGGVGGWFKNIDTDHINHLLFGYLGKKVKRNFYLRLGIAGSYSFEDLLILPVAGISIGFKDHFAFEVMFPSHVILRAKINQRFEVGSKISIVIKDAGVSSSIDDIKSSMQQLNCGLYLDSRIIKTLIARVEGGVALWRDLLLSGRGAGKELDFDPGVTPYLRFSLRWQI